MKQVSVSFLVLAVAGFLLTSQAAFGAGAEEPAMTQTVGEGPYGKYDPPVEVTLVHTAMTQIRGGRAVWQVRSTGRSHSRS